MTQEQWRSLKESYARKRMARAYKVELRALHHKLQSCDHEEETWPIRHRILWLNDEIRRLEGRLPGWLQAFFPTSKLDKGQDT